MAACSQGTLTPTQASQLCLALAANGRAAEIDNTTRRMDAVEELLEEHNAAPKQKSR